MATTNIIDSIHNLKSKSFYRYSKDVILYNNIASKVMARHAVPQIDLYAFTMQFGQQGFKDHAHYLPEVCAQQGAYVAGYVNAYARFKNLGMD